MLAPPSILTLSACGEAVKQMVASRRLRVFPVVVKGPLENALVFLDYDDDGVLDPGEPSVRSASTGRFSCPRNKIMLGLSLKQTAPLLILRRVRKVADVVLKAPTGSTVITPTTTIMKEANISKEEVVEILGLPESVDPTTFNPFDEEADPDVALAVEKVSQQVMTTVKSIASAVEGSGSSADDAFEVAIKSVVKVVQEKVAEAQSDGGSSVTVIDFTDTEDLTKITEKVSEVFAEENLASEEDFQTFRKSLL